MHPVSCTNAHHDVTDLVNHVMVILRSYCLVAEVTFKPECKALTA